MTGGMDALDPAREKPSIDLLDEIIAAISLVEVTVHSLADQDIGSIEQEVLKRALKTLWTIHDGLSDPPGADDDDDDDDDDDGG